VTAPDAPKVTRAPERCQSASVRHCHGLVIAWGDMMQNNHHKHPMHTSTASRWFEIDVVGLVIRGLARLGVVHPRVPIDASRVSAAGR